MSLQFCLSRSRHHRLLGEPCQESAWTGRMQAAYLGGRPGAAQLPDDRARGVDADGANAYERSLFEQRGRPTEVPFGFC